MHAPINQTRIALTFPVRRRAFSSSRRVAVTTPYNESLMNALKRRSAKCNLRRVGYRSELRLFLFSTGRVTDPAKR
jgi:hypothetical protein